VFAEIFMGADSVCDWAEFAVTTKEVAEIPAQRLHAVAIHTGEEPRAEALVAPTVTEGGDACPFVVVEGRAHGFPTAP
jgi:hypothetical protein